MNRRAASRLSRGMLLQGRYRIQQLIGSGGMSYVYAATDERLMGKLWAVKESIPVGIDRDHLHREMKWLTALRHPNLPHIVDYFTSDQDGHAYLVMELIEGLTLQERIKRNPINFQEVVSIAKQLCDALHYLHHQDPPIIYRDLKPSNVMIIEDGSIKLIDFGIARQLKQDSVADTVKLGTIGFAAPEQYEGKQSDSRTDLYAIGALLAYLLSEGKWCGTIPLREGILHKELPEGFTAIIKKLLSVEPVDRYNSANELLMALKPYCADQDNHPLGSKGLSVSMDEGYGTNMAGKVLAFLGASSGIGTTYIALSVAYSIARLFKGKVAYIDAADKHSLTIPLLYRHVEGETWIESQGEESTFNWNGVCHIPLNVLNNSSLNMIMPQLQTKFNYIIVDLGYGSDDERLLEFMRATASAIVGSAVPWRNLKMDVPLTRMIELEYTRWSYLIPTQRQMDLIRDHPAYGFCTQILSFPDCKDPFRGSISLDQWVEKWLNLTVSQRERRRLGSWLRRMYKQQKQQEVRE